MSAQRIETLSWILIYGGLLAAGLGWFMTSQPGPWGELVMAGGGIAAAVGIVLIVIRSKLKQP